MPAKLTLPTVGLMDRQFRYRRSEHTDISKTFARVRKAQRQAEQQGQSEQQALDLGATGTVVPLQARGQRGAA